MDTVRRRTRWGRWLLIVLLALLVVAYVVAWFVMKPMIETFADDWVEQQRAAGYEIEFTDRRVEGFPLNFELVFDDPVYGDPISGAKYEGEQLRLESRTWDFVAMLAQRWGKLDGKIPGSNRVVSRGGDEIQMEVGRNTQLTYSWTADGPTGARLRVDTLNGSATSTAFDTPRNFSTEAFNVSVLPSSSSDGLFDLSIAWRAISLPQEQLLDLRSAVDSGSIPPPANLMASNLVGALEDGGPFELTLPGVISSEGGQLQFLGGLLN